MPHASLASVLILLATAATATADDAALRSGTFSPPRQAPEFSLTGSDGAELNLARYRGKVVVLGFGFTSCAGACPVTLAVLAQARKQLAAEASQMQVVYVSVDPERDDPVRMRKFLSAFDSNFIGGTGEAATLAAVREQYGILTSRKPAGEISHSSYTYLIDRAGRLRALMPYGRPAEDYVHDIRILLKQ